MALNFDVWVVEYSKLADSRGSFPFHIEPLGRNHPDNEWSNSWQEILRGTCEDAFQKYGELVKEWEEKMPPNKACS
jgi:hypothetical protein